jgi:ppGpp synthetase/RelA/SpoT-type nucleotidyltranferase
MLKLARLYKIAWSIAIRFAAVRDSFEFSKKDLQKLVPNPNPEGRKRQVTQQYADEWLAQNRHRPSLNKRNIPILDAQVSGDTDMAQALIKAVPKKGQSRAQYNQKVLQHLKNKKSVDPNFTHKNSFDDLKDEDKEKMQSIANKTGSEITKSEVEFFVDQFENAFEECKSLTKFVGSGAETFSGRLKDDGSLFEKLKGKKWSQRKLESLNDIIGTRCVCKNIAEQNRLISYVYENHILLEHDDSVNNERPDGYRAHHFTVRTSSGRLMELQVKTYNQQLYSDFTHPIYKEKQWQNDPEVAAFTKALSDYVYAIDSGKGEPKIKPKVPENLKSWLKERNLSEFDFNSLLKA